MVSNMLEFREKFQNHNDFTTSNAYILGRKLEQLLNQAQDTPMFERHDLPASNYLNPAIINSKPPISRRHSSSVYSNPATTQAKLSTLVETKNLFNAVLAAGLESLAEEKIRNRAFSEGAFIDPQCEQQQPPQSSTSRYKTELCRPFEENGKCKYGEKCQFAHGRHELRQMVRHPKYKTELCRTYHTTGLCPYGPRCHFIHNQDEIIEQPSANHVGLKQTAVPISQAQRQVINSGNLQLSNARINRSYSPPQITSPTDVSLPFFETGPMSPISPPIAKSNNPNFTYSNRISYPSVQANIVDRRSPPLYPDFRNLSPTEDSLFDGSSSDSDRESHNSSPPGFGNLPVAPPTTQQTQRLPIFRCLSQSS